MKSRMEKYYNNSQEFVGRTSKNESLYRKRDYNVYSSNETVIDTNNEIDITKIKDIIKSREDYQRAKSYRTMLNDKTFEYDDIPYTEEPFEEKDYDINALLKKVKDERGIKEEQDKVRKLKNTQYDILSKLDLKSKVKTEEQQKEELKDLINTITKKEDSELDLLAELKAENTLVTKRAEELEKEVTSALKPELLEAQKLESKQEEDSDFYSDSFTFSKKDFEGMKDLESNVKTNNKLIKILIFVLILIILTVGLFVLDSFFDFIPFV